MKKLFIVLIFTFYVYSYAQDAEVITSTPTLSLLPQSTEISISSGNVTLDFKEADINNVLKIISYKSGVNIVTTPDVIGNVSVRLTDVPWEMALDVILKTYGFGYQKQGNVILVTKIENVAKIASEESLQTEIITLKFLDAQDAQKILIPLLSTRGQISVLYSRGQKGWEFTPLVIGGKEVASTQAKEKETKPMSETIIYEKTVTGTTANIERKFDPAIKSKVLIITDTASTLDKIRNVILPKIDIKPKQVLIETKIIEVNRNTLKDIGFDWGLGGAGSATTNTILFNDISNGRKLGGHAAGTLNPATGTSYPTPSVFGPSTTNILGYHPYNAGAEFIFQKLTGTKFEAVIHALEDNADTNTLSAPSILTLDNQEASMFIGYHTPILGSYVTAGTTTTGPTVTQNLDYYQGIGIRLNVVPQVSEEGYINLIIYPSITSSTANVTATNTAGTSPNQTTTTTSYPIIDVREAQTQVLLRDGETVVIGGLLKDVKSKEFIGIPFLSKLPWVGKFFGRETNDTQKIDLLIFITAKIIKEGEFTPEELAKLEKRLERNEPVVVKVGAADRKKKKK